MVVGYEEATEQESSSSRCFFLSGCKGFLDIKGDIGCIDKDVINNFYYFNRDNTCNQVKEKSIENHSVYYKLLGAGQGYVTK